MLRMQPIPVANTEYAVLNAIPDITNIILDVSLMTVTIAELIIIDVVPMSCVAIMKVNYTAFQSLAVAHIYV